MQWASFSLLAPPEHIYGDSLKSGEEQCRGRRGGRRLRGMRGGAGRGGGTTADKSHKTKPKKESKV
jgi:hypothetical protein